MTLKVSIEFCGLLGDDILILRGGDSHFLEINILTLKIMKINNLSCSGMKINNLTLTFLELREKCANISNIFRLSSLALTVKFFDKFYGSLRLYYINKTMMYPYPTLNTYTYNVSMAISRCKYEYVLYIYYNIQIYLFQNGQPTYPLVVA